MEDDRAYGHKEGIGIPKDKFQLIYAKTLERPCQVPVLVLQIPESLSDISA